VKATQYKTIESTKQRLDLYNKTKIELVKKSTMASVNKTRQAQSFVSGGQKTSTTTVTTTRYFVNGKEQKSTV